jgi:NCS1 family nucleobase:cation symporter-1
MRRNGVHSGRQLGKRHIASVRAIDKESDMTASTAEGIEAVSGGGKTPAPKENDNAVIIKDSYDERLANADLAPLKKQSWSWYNIFAFWMSDVHSVGGYVTAGSLFALGIASWQVLISLIVGIVIVQLLVNLVAKPSQRLGVPFPVTTRFVFGVKGANIPAVIRGIIAVAWYGVQTFLASESLDIIFLKFIPASHALATDYSFLGLSALGWISYGILWVAQAAVFWRGMDTIRSFIDWAGPLVYAVMFILAIYLVVKAGRPEPYQPQPLVRRAAELRQVHPGHDYRRSARRVVLRRPDAQLR